MYSKEHEIYLKQIKKTKFYIRFTQLISVILCLVFWQLFADLNIINTFILSSPLMILKTILNMLENNLFTHIKITVIETLLSFIIGTFIGILIAAILWCNKFLNKVMDPFLTVLNSLPKIALGPILIIWIGANINSIIMMSLLISCFTTIITILESFNNTNINMIKLLQSFGSSKIQIFKYLIFPYNYKTIISSLKINISMSLVGVIMGEMLVSKEGLGYLIVYGSQIFNLNLVMSSIIILSFISSLLYYILLFIEKKIIKNI